MRGALIRRVNSGSERSRINRWRGGGTIATWLDSNASVSSGEGLYFSVVKGGLRKNISVKARELLWNGTEEEREEKTCHSSSSLCDRVRATCGFNSVKARVWRFPASFCLLIAHAKCENKRVGLAHDPCPLGLCRIDLWLVNVGLSF